MGKRSSFERNPRDFYKTPKEAVNPLLPYITFDNYYDPCAGDGVLAEYIPGNWKMSDIEPQATGILKKDALSLTSKDLDNTNIILTNPPWDRKLLHPMITLFSNLKPTWLLFDAGWMFTKQSSLYMKKCKYVVAIGRIKWIPNSKMSGKDDAAWYHFVSYETNTTFIGR